MSRIADEYYCEIEPEKRLSILESCIQNGDDSEENKLRKEVFELRYQCSKKGRQVIYADMFLAFWTGMQFYQEALEKPRKVKWAKKGIIKEMERIHFREFEAKSKLHQKLLYWEMRHLVRVYVSSCKSDRMYSKMMCGFGNMNENYVMEKIKCDIHKTVIELPKLLDLEKELSVFIQAAKDEYYECFAEELS